MGHRGSRDRYGVRGGVPVKGDSPWWDALTERVARDHVGRVLTVEEVGALVPPYPNGRTARPSAAVRRLSRCLELVERGPNGSLTRGATYRVVALAPRAEPIGEGAPEDEVPPVDQDYLDAAIDRIIGRTKK